jgi:hypothetical protein
MQDIVNRVLVVLEEMRSEPAAEDTRHETALELMSSVPSQTALSLENCSP